MTLFNASYKNKKVFLTGKITSREQESFKTKGFKLTPKKELCCSYDVYLKFREELNATEDDSLKELLKSLENSIDFDNYFNNECEFKLREFQKEFVYWFNDPKKTRCACINASECGLGKTIMSLAAIFATGKDKPLIILCPKNAVSNWKEHLEKFKYPHPIINKLEPGLNCCILTYEALNPTLKEANEKKSSLESLNKQFMKNTVIIADEFHKTKSKKTKITKRFRTLFKLIAKKEGKCIALTATPILNRVSELKTLLENIDLFKLCFGNAVKFNELFGGVFDFRRRYMVWDASKRKPEEIKQRVKDTIFLKKKIDVLDQLPEIISSVIKVDLKEKYLKSFPEIGTAGAMLANTSSPTFKQYMKLRQALSLEKLKDIESELETWESMDKPLLAFSCFSEPVHLLGSRKGWAFIDGSTSGEKRKELADLFNAKKVHLAISIGTGATALNLGAGDTAIFLDLDLTPGLNTQARGRNDRINAQHKKLNYLYVISNHPFEQEMLDLIIEKEKLIQDTF